MIELTLFQRDDCPLCDEAHERLLAAGVADFEPVWIDGDPVLEGKYGTRVPVLRRKDSGAELGWPFEVEQVRRFLAVG